MITLETNDDNSGMEIKDSADDKGKIFMFILFIYDLAIASQMHASTQCAM